MPYPNLNFERGRTTLLMLAIFSLMLELSMKFFFLKKVGVLFTFTEKLQLTNRHHYLSNFYLLSSKIFFATFAPGATIIHCLDLRSTWML